MCAIIVSMRKSILLVAFLLIASAPQAATVLTSPTELPAEHRCTWIFLGGSIDMGSAPDWQRDIVRRLKDLDVMFLNPRRDDWNTAWRAEADDPNFRQQVRWELAALEASDVIIMYLAPKSQSPISLLELGLYARSGKLVLFCPPGFWRKGNVDLTASFYGIEQVSSTDDLVAAVRRRVIAKGASHH